LPGVIRSTRTPGRFAQVSRPSAASIARRV
jgi:hypothetical protein